MLEVLEQAWALCAKPASRRRTCSTSATPRRSNRRCTEATASSWSEPRFWPPDFTLRLGLKGLRPLLQTAETQEAPMPPASLIHDQLLTGVARGIRRAGLGAAHTGHPENAGCPA
jgi:hypothetical protein